MTKFNQIKLFEEKKVRAVYDDVEEKWYFSIVDVCGVLTESKDPLTARKYWNKLKQRLKEEGNETVTNCHQLKLQAVDGKMRKTDVVRTVFRNSRKGFKSPQHSDGAFQLPPYGGGRGERPNTLQCPDDRAYDSSIRRTRRKFFGPPSDGDGATEALRSCVQ